jgi:hypothetical protein
VRGGRRQGGRPSFARHSGLREGGSRRPSFGPAMQPDAACSRRPGSAGPRPRREAGTPWPDGSRPKPEGYSDRL